MTRAAYVPLSLVRSLQTTHPGQRVGLSPGVLGVLFVYEDMERLREDWPESDVITISYEEPDEVTP